MHDKKSQDKTINKISFNYETSNQLLYASRRFCDSAWHDVDFVAQNRDHLFSDRRWHPLYYSGTDFSHQLFHLQECKTSRYAILDRGNRQYTFRRDTGICSLFFCYHTDVPFGCNSRVGRHRADRYFNSY